MTSHRLAGSRVPIVEDEFFLADDARTILSGEGAEILGPVATVNEARAVIEREPRIDGVLLDVNLRGEKAFEFADALQSRGIPFAFVTGYDVEMLPERFADVTSVAKPVRPDQLINVFGALVASASEKPVGTA